MSHCKSLITSNAALIVAPLAPWFNPLYYENGNNYRDVFIKTGKAIDWYNVKYYDQGEDAYTDCTVSVARPKPWG
jgi:hypothetical protein